MARKPRGDSKLERISDDAHDDLIEWMIHGTGDEAKEKLLETYDVSTNNEALGKFYRKYCVGVKIRRSRREAADIKRLLAEDDAGWDAATLELVEQRAFDEAMAKDGDLDVVIELQKLKISRLKLQLQVDKLDIDKRRVSLLEKKSGMFDKIAEAVGDETLTDADLRQMAIAAVDDILMPNKGAKK